MQNQSVSELKLLLISRINESGILDYYNDFWAAKALRMKSKDTILNLASRVFAPKLNDLLLNQAFVSGLTENFQSESELLDFSIDSKRMESAKVINAWIAERTNREITDVVNSQDLNDDTRLFMVGVGHFKGKLAELIKQIDSFA